MTLEERLAMHKKMAEAYWSAYQTRNVEDGAKYEDWVFAPHATYSVTMPDWAPLDCRCWPSDRGFVMLTHFGGHTPDGVLHDFYAYGFVDTNEKGEITHWETHVSPEYNDFLDAAIGVHGPFPSFKNGAGEYMQAVAKRMQEKGVKIHLQ